MSTILFRPRNKVEHPKGTGGEEAIKEPLPAPRPLPRTKMQVIVPVVIGVAVLGMIALMFSQPGLRSGYMGVFTLFLPLMLLVSMTSMFMMNRGGGEKRMSPGELEEARRERLAELDELRERMHDAGRAQFEQFAWLHPEPRLVAGLIGSDRMWSRSLNSDLAPLFGVVRFGVGTSALTRKLQPADVGRAEDYDPVTFDANSAFLQVQKEIQGAPKPVALQNTAGLALIGEQDMEPVYGLARSIICQAVLGHAPRDFKIMIVTDDLQRWEWCKWLPHCQHPSAMDSGGPARMVWTSGEQLNAAVGAELHGREPFSLKPPGAGVRPHWLVINDRTRPAGDERDWQTLTRAGGVAGVTFMRLASQRGSGLEFTERSTYFVSGDEVRRRGERFCTPDYVDEATARTVARKIARYRSDGEGAPLAGGRSPVEEGRDLGDLLGVEDVANVDVAKTWASTLLGPPWKGEPWGREWARIPVGVDEKGQQFALDFKEPHQGGMGPHLVIVGWTGSGKSTFLTTLATSAAVTHSPETLTIAFFDFKGKTTADQLYGLPNVVAAMGNLEDDELWIDRMGEVLLGELNRRKELLHAAGLENVAEYEYRRIHKGESLEPLPFLLVIVDEFTQMFQDYPDSKKWFDEIGRQGRALNVGFVMGSQRLGYEMQQGTMANVAARVALKVLDDGDSRTMLGTDAAVHLPANSPGAGFLNVKGNTGGLVRFQACFVGKPYTPPRRVAAAVVRTQHNYVPPQLFTAAPMAALPAPPTPQAVTAEPTPQVLLGDDGRELRELDVIKRSLRQQVQSRVHQMWLPPLQPLPVDELVHRLRGRAWHEDYGNTAGLILPVGMDDRPYRHTQKVVAIDLMAGNCAVIGKGGAGKTTALTTMITGAALMYRPQRVQFYVLALGGPILNSVAALPHVGDVVRANQTERIGRTLAEMTQLIEDRAEAFTKHDITIKEFRARKFGGERGALPDDGFGDVVLVIDGWQKLKSASEEWVDQVMSIMRDGPNYGVRVIVSTNAWLQGGMPSGMPSMFASNVELKLDSGDDTNKNSRAVAIKVPFDEDVDHGAGEVNKNRGRGTSMFGFHMQVGLPEVRIGDQVGGPREVGAAITQLTGDRAATVRVLPDEVLLEQVWAQWTQRTGAAPPVGRVPFGISEAGLQPAVAEFAVSPHLLIVGNPDCGRSNALAAVAQSIMRAYTPEQAQIYMVDPHNAQLQVVEGEFLGSYVDETGKTQDGYTFHEEDVRQMANYVARILQQRQPDKTLGQSELAAGRRSWSGPEYFIIVDNEETVAEWGAGMFTGPGPALEPLAALITRARDVGLHFVVSRRVSPWSRALGSPVVGRLAQSQVPAVVMDAPRDEMEVLGLRKPPRQPVGRGIYITEKLTAPVQIALAERR